MKAVSLAEAVIVRVVWLIIGCCSILALSAGAAAAAPQTAGPSMTCTLKLGQFYTTNQWVPLAIRLTNPTDRILGGFVEFTAGRDSDMVTRQAVHVPAHSQLDLDTVIRAGVPQRHRMAPGEITSAVWTDSDGQQLCRAGVGGVRIGGVPSGHSPSEDLPPTSLLVIDTLSRPTDSQRDGLESFISTDAGMQIARAVIGSVSLLPRSVIAYGGIDYILLLLPPDQLDAPQRQALLEHIRQGGTLIVSGAYESANLQDSWLADLLPVQMIGWRQASGFTDAGGHTFKLLQTTPISEAILPPITRNEPVHVALQDAHYVFAAVRPVGLGRVVFTSFAPEDLDLSDPDAKAIWHDLLNWQRPAAPAVSMAETLATQRTNMMSEILGRSAPAWGLAAGIAGGYVLAVLAVQLGFAGTRRPAAFAVAGVIALLTCGGIILATSLRGGQNTITGARLTWIQLGPDGTGQTREQDAFFGSSPNPAAAIISTSPQVQCQPIGYDSNDPPTEEPIPFRSTQVGIRSDGIGRIWQATAASTNRPVQVHASFGSAGLQLHAHNAMTASIHAPLLVWGRSILRLGDLSSGSSDLAVGPADLNPPGTYTHGGGIVSATDSIRGQLVRNVVDENDPTDPATLRPPAVLGWLDDQNAPPLLSLQASAIIRAQTMIRVPLQIDPSPPGPVRVEAPFVRFTRFADTAMPPLDANGNASNNAEQSWLMTVVPPAEIGSFTPTAATLSVHLDSPQSMVTIGDGPSTALPLATWNHAIGPRSVSFEIKPADLSADHQLVLRVSVQNSGAANGVRWSMQQLTVMLDGRVE